MAGDLCIGTIDSWLLWNLTSGAVHACDASNASRTQLMNLRTLSWDAALLEVFGCLRPRYPTSEPSSGVVGYTVGSGRLAAGIPIAG